MTQPPPELSPPVYARFGVLAHPARPATFATAAHIAERLRARGASAWFRTEWDEADLREHAASADVVVAIGGDGAMLRAARICALFGVPVLGVNMGYLGFLTEIKSPDDWPAAEDGLFAGHTWTETRLMLAVEVWRGRTCLAVSDALNDAVISRAGEIRTIRLDAYIAGDWTTTYNADALVIATSTGSTAYALASGGPILPPEARNLLIVPVAPHLSLDRPMVLPEGVVIDAVVSPNTPTAPVLSVDGIRLADLVAGDRVHVRASRHTARFLRLRERHYFYRSLLDRLEPRAPAHDAPPPTLAGPWRDEGG